METAIITQLFEEKQLQDVLPLIQSYLDIYNYKEFTILGYPVQFGKNIESDYDIVLDCSRYCKHIIIKKILDKYKDFDKMIYETCIKMRHIFVESEECKLYKKITINLIKISFLRIRNNNNYLFKIIVFETGKGGRSYYISAGKININL